MIREATEAGLQLIARPNILRYQYMLVFAKNTPPPQTQTRSREIRNR